MTTETATDTATPSTTASGSVAPADPTVSASVASPSPAVPLRSITITPALSHVHGAAVDGADLIVATHHGLYRVNLATGAAGLIGTAEADFMALARSASGRLFASGHPGPGLGEVDPLGLVTSEDEGTTWQTISLAGEVDFHALASRGDELVGWDTSGPLRWSQDGGRTWAAGPTIAATSIALFADLAWLATPEQGLLTWRPGSAEVGSVGLPTVLVAASAEGETIWRIDSDGTVHRSKDGSRWTAVCAVRAAEGLAAERDRAYVVTATEVMVLGEQ